MARSSTFLVRVQFRVLHVLRRDVLGQFSWYRLEVVYRRLSQVTLNGHANGVKSEVKAEPGTVKRSLKGVNFFLEGKVDKDTLKALIEKHGGHVSSRVSGKVAAVISTPGKFGLTFLSRPFVIFLLSLF